MKDLKKENSIFSEVEKEYKKLIDNNLKPSLRYNSSYRIAYIIINYCLEKDQRKVDFNLINKSRSKKLKDKFSKVNLYEVTPYYNHEKGKLRFLCDFNYIPSEFEYIFKHLLKLKHNISFSDIEQKDNKLTFLSLHKLVNIIIEWFYESESKRLNYLKPLNIKQENNLIFKKIEKERIKTFFNIKKNEVWIEKYKTIISYIVALSPIITTIIIYLYHNNDFVYLFLGDIEDNEPLVITIFFIQVLITTIFCIIGYFNTIRLVTKPIIRFIRFFIYGIGLAPIIISIIFSIFFIVDSSNNIEGWFNNTDSESFFDQDPNGNGEGFLFVSDFRDSERTIRRKVISTDSLRLINGGIGVFRIIFDVKNIGNKKIDSLNYKINYKFVDSNYIRFQITPFLFNQETTDMIKIKIKNNEIIEIIGTQVIYKKIKDKNKFAFIKKEFETPKLNGYNKLPDIYPIGRDSILQTSLVLFIMVTEERK